MLIGCDLETLKTCLCIQTLRECKIWMTVIWQTYIPREGDRMNVLNGIKK